MTQIPNITAQQTEHNVGQQQKRLWAPEERLSLQDRESSLKQREWPPPQTPPRPPPHIFSHTMTNQMLPFRAQVTCSLTLTPPLPTPPPPPAGCWDAGMQSAVAAPSETLTSGCHLELSPLHPRSAGDWQDFWRILLFPMQPAAPPLHKQCLWLHSLSADFKQIFSLWNIIQNLQLLCVHWENNPALTIPLKLIGFSHREWEIRYRRWLKRPTYLFHFLSFYPASFKITEPIPCSRSGPFHSSPPDGRFTTS